MAEFQRKMQGGRGIVTAIKEMFRKSRRARVLTVLAIAAVFLAGCIYLFYHNPKIYPVPCVIHTLTGIYCPGCGAGRACYALLHGRLYEAFAYNPFLLLLLPFLGLYLAARCVDWMITGKNHIDSKISVRLLVIILIAVLLYGVVRNIPIFPFTLLAPGGILGKF